MTAYIEGTLVRVGQSGVALRAAATGPVVQVIWPNGYSARDEAGHLVVLDSSGSIVAQEGDRVSFGGGFTGQGTWYACSGPKILAP